MQVVPRALRVVVVAWLATALPLTAHGRLTVFGAAGHGFGRGGGLGASSVIYDENLQLVSREDHYGSMGEGRKLLLGIRAPLQHDVVARVEAGYSTMPSRVVTVRAPGEPLFPESEDVYTGHVLHVAGLVTMTTTVGAHAAPYIGVGAGVYTASLRDDLVYNRFGDLISARVASRFDPALGVIGVLGMEWRTDRAFAPFVELAAEQVSFRMTRLDVVEAHAFGMPFDYDVDPYTEGTQATLAFDRDTPGKPAPPIEQASSMSIRAGVSVTF